jgi:hypothetical protein
MLADVTVATVSTSCEQCREDVSNCHCDGAWSVSTAANSAMNSQKLGRLGSRASAFIDPHTGDVRVILTSPQNSVLGEILHHLFYCADEALLNLAPNSTGYPHNGGQHSLTIWGKQGDVVSYLDLLIEVYSARPRYAAGVEELRGRQRVARQLR